MGKILPDLTQQSQSMQARIAELEAQLAVAKRQAHNPKVSFKVTDKGGMSVYGLGRFPVTLYRGQWERLLGQKEAIEAFIQANSANLSVKE
jgi:hypothetical protein